MKYYHSIGKRKTSIASIYLYKKNKNKKYFIKINKLKYNIYFKNNNIIIYKILFPLIITKNINKFHININIKGGGYTGQSEAISLGISKILYLIDNKYKKILKKYYLLTRDSRIVERKKYGRKKARKKFQFSKR
ncbi:MAG: 30S ribosomal protein S9 [Candidatus Shikimatogenerans bostrichidophilus]|nr:MAG: 30S ribosomal protein S9 [Candidatus Shikimatogenerans bostrichidophilus]